jgi:hypothetical protein
VQLGDIGELAADAVERLADDDIEGAVFGIPAQLLQPRPETTGAADRGIRRRGLSATAWSAPPTCWRWGAR